MGMTGWGGGGVLAKMNDVERMWMSRRGGARFVFRPSRGWTGRRWWKRPGVDEGGAGGDIRRWVAGKKVVEASGGLVVREMVEMSGGWCTSSG